MGKTFENLFNYLLDRKQPLVTMALYRMKGTKNNEYPYVYTNPDAGTIITHRDKAFVLGIEIPQELRGDIYEMMEKEGNLQLSLNSKVNASGGDTANPTSNQGNMFDSTYLGAN